MVKDNSHSSTEILNVVLAFKGGGGRSNIPEPPCIQPSTGVMRIGKSVFM